MKRFTIGVVVFGLLTFLALTLAFTESGLHLPPNPVPAARADAARALAVRYKAAFSTVTIDAKDGVTLEAWDFRRSAEAPTVLVLHGHADNKGSMLGYTDMLLAHGYSVLLPDARGHGNSSGNLLTFGFYERDDLKRWADLATSRQQAPCLYAAGVSMGAGIVLQSLPVIPRFCAVVAESSYSSFRDVGIWRMQGLFGNVPFFPALLVGSAFGYARLRFGVDLDQVSPERAIAETRTPVLLIHGTDDVNIPIEQSRKLLRTHRPDVEFWEVPGGTHVRIRGADPAGYARRVYSWFDTHYALRNEAK